MPIDTSAFDQAWGISSEQSQFTENRGFIGDFAHDLFVGSAEAIDLMGSGLGGDNKITQFSDWMKGASLYKPDASTYYGNDSFGKRIFSGITQAAPASFTPIIAGIAGTVAGGPAVGIGAGLGTMVEMFGSGTYFKALEEGRSQGMQGDALHNFALKLAASELGTEVLGDLTAGAAGGLFKGGAKGLMRALKTNKVSPDTILNEVAGHIGTKRTLVRLFGGASVEGGTEVLNSLYQNYVRAQEGLEVPDEDLLETFAIGFGLGGGMGAGASVYSNQRNRQAKTLIEQRLNSPDVNERIGMHQEIRNTLSPDMQKTWDQYVPAITKGPMTPGDFTKAEELAREKFQGDQEKIQKVMEKPEEILKEYGIIGEGAFEPSRQIPAELRANPLDVFIEESFTNQPSFADILAERYDPSLPRKEAPKVPLGGTTVQGAFVPRETETVQTDEAPGAAGREIASRGAYTRGRQGKPARPFDYVRELRDTEEYSPELPPKKGAPSIANPEVQTTKGAFVGSTTETPEVGTVGAPAEIKSRNDFTRGREGARPKPFDVVTESRATAEYSPELPTVPQGQVAGIEDSQEQRYQFGQGGFQTPRDQYGMLSPEAREKLPSEVVARVESKVFKMPREKAEVRAKVDKGEFVPEEKLKKNKEYLPKGQKIQKKAPNRAKPILQESKGTAKGKNWEAKYTDGSTAKMLYTDTYEVTLPDGRKFRARNQKDIIEGLRNPDERVRKYEERVTSEGEIKKGAKKTEEKDLPIEGEAFELMAEFLPDVQKVKGTDEEISDAQLDTARDTKVTEAVLKAKETVSRDTEEKDTPKGIYMEAFRKNLQKVRNRKPREEKSGVSIEEDSATTQSAEDTAATTEATSILAEVSKIMKETKDTVAAMAEIQKRFTEDQLKAAKELASQEREQSTAEVVAPKKGDIVTFKKEKGEQRWTSKDGYEVEMVRESPKSNTYVAQLSKDGTVLRAMGTREEAFDLANDIEKAKEIEAEAMSEPTSVSEEEYFEETTLGELMNRVSDSEVPQIRAMIGFLQNIVPLKKKEVKVRYDSNAESSSFTTVGGEPVITLKGYGNDAIAIHEIVHAITSVEMLKNPEVRTEVKNLLETVKKDLVKRGILSESDIREIEETDTSKKFKQRFDEDYFGGMRGVAYGLINEQEFLSQAFTSPEFQRVLSTLKMPGKKKMSIFEWVIDLAARVLGVSGMQKSALHEVFRLTAELAQEDVSDLYRKDTGVVDEALEGTSERRMGPIKDYDGEVAKSYEGEPQTRVGAIKDSSGDFYKSVKTTVKDLFEPISDAVFRLAPDIAGKLKRMDAASNLNYTRYLNVSRSFLEDFKNLSEDDKRKLSMALYNGDRKTASAMIDMSGVDRVLDELDIRARDVGLLYGKKKKKYFPRRVNDLFAYLDYLKKEPGSALYDEVYRRKGKDLTDVEKTALIANSLQSGNIHYLPRPGATKDRTVPFVDGESYQFYGDASDALVGHIFEMNEKISYREFAGGNQRAKKIMRMEELVKLIDAGRATPKQREEYQELAYMLEDPKKELEETVAWMVKEAGEKLPTEQHQELSDLLKVRLRPKGPHGFVDNVRNVGYITTMGNFMSALTQLADIPISFYANGWNKDTASAAMGAFGTIAKLVSTDIGRKTGLTPQFDLKDSFIQSMDFTNQLREFSKGNLTSNLLDRVFRYSGLKYTDLIGKESFMQASYKKINRMDQEEFMQKYEPMFGQQTLDAYNQRSNRSSDFTKMMVFAELSNWQPISMSQQSKTYVGGGNVRLFYMLKTFTMRATGAAVREGLSEYTASDKGNMAKAKFVSRVGSIVLLYAMAGASADELKDLLKGKEADFISDNVVENLMSMFLVSRFDAAMGLERDQIITKIVHGNMPPIRWADQIGGDLYSIFSDDKEMKFKTLNLIPLVGNLLYGYSDAGRSTEYRWRKQKIRDKMSEGSATDLTQDIAEYNRWALENDESPINAFEMLTSLQKEEALAF